jgi:hypothetical protein
MNSRRTVGLAALFVGLALAAMLRPPVARAADDGWHDIPCGDSSFAQPETYDGPIECRAGPTHGADMGSGQRETCSAREYSMAYGRAVRGADVDQPLVHFRAYILENNTSRCHMRIGTEHDIVRAEMNLAAAWAGAITFMDPRKIAGGRAIQFASRDNRRCLAFLKWWRTDVSDIDGVYCDPPGRASTDQPYTDDEIKTRVGAARLKD